VKLGVISDTHGLMRPQALEALAGSELILHAGDIGSGAVLSALESIAPVVAFRGNNDTETWAACLPETTTLQAGGARLHLLHSVKDLKLDPLRSGLDVIVSGHSHKPLIETHEGVLYLNPGSAGPRRFSLPVTVARLNLDDGRAEAEIVALL
jgi:putative phosphoesterase